MDGDACWRSRDQERDGFHSLLLRMTSSLFSFVPTFLASDQERGGFHSPPQVVSSHFATAPSRAAAGDPKRREEVK